jgi:hypothetical protein
MSLLTPSRHAGLISLGLASGLGTIPFHGEGPLVRRLMAGADVHPQAGTHVAVHRVDAVGDETRTYCDVHEHTVGELNLLLPRHRADLRHRAGRRAPPGRGPGEHLHPRRAAPQRERPRGIGFFVAIVLRVGDYARSFARVP